MHSILSSVNLIDRNIFPKENRDNRTDRGYHEKSFLTGEHLLIWRDLLDKNKRVLSLADITNDYCKSNIDLYLEKGINKESYEKIGVSSRHNSILGDLIEGCILSLKDLKSPKSPRPYEYLIELSDIQHSKFVQERNEKILEMSKKERDFANSNTSEKVVDGLRYCCRFEIILKILQNFFYDDAEIEFKPKSIIPERILGIGHKATPDFLVKINGSVVVGDIKSGDKFGYHHKMTCTGYALAYESHYGVDVNFGMVYFIPTTNVQVLSKNHFIFPQIYIFEIDSSLRRDFLESRNSKYEIIGTSKLPKFPKDKTRCRKSCKYSKTCLSLMPKRKARASA